MHLSGADTGFERIEMSRKVVRLLNPPSSANSTSSNSKAKTLTPHQKRKIFSKENPQSPNSRNLKEEIQPEKKPVLTGAAAHPSVRARYGDLYKVTLTHDEDMVSEARGRKKPQRKRRKASIFFFLGCRRVWCPF